MGINVNAGFSRLIRNKRSYHEFSGMSLLMLGKQDVNFKREKLKSILDRIGFEYRTDIIEIDDYDERNEKIDSYDLFKLLGFETVYALDISDYEGADIICDLAVLELPEELVNQFDYIYDGGVLEHIFNFPQALVNTSKMLKVGGKIIHDVPCGNLVDHGFYSFSPTCLIDYYKNNHFFINDIYLMGYQYPHFDMVNVISPDCRYNDSNEWCNTFAKGYNILMICEATKESNTGGGNLFFPQYSYAILAEKLKRDKVIYSYEHRMERLKRVLQANPKCRIAIYGTGITANKIVGELWNSLDNIVGVYDGKMKSGNTVEFDICEKTVLNIDDVHRDNIQYIVLGSEKMDVIEMIRQRIKYLKNEGIEII